MPLTEPCLEISPTRLFGNTSSIRGQSIGQVIYLRCRQRIVFLKLAILGISVALLLTPSVNPFIGKFGCLTRVFPQCLEIATCGHKKLLSSASHAKSTIISRSSRSLSASPWLGCTCQGDYFQRNNT